MAFFEQLGKRLSDAGQDVAQKTRNLADVTQLNSANNEKEKQIKRLIFDLGKAYYENHKNDFTAEGAELISNINALYKEIYENNEKIKQIKGVVKCEKCGADIASGDAFCTVCGAKANRPEPVVAAAQPQPQPQAQRLCPTCGAAVPEGNLFCTKCGTRL